MSWIRSRCGSVNLIRTTTRPFVRNDLARGAGAARVARAPAGAVEVLDDDAELGSLAAELDPVAGAVAARASSLRAGR